MNTAGQQVTIGDERNKRRISKRRLDMLRRVELMGEPAHLVAKDLGISTEAVQKALRSEQAAIWREQMLADEQRGARLHAWLELGALRRHGTKEDGVKLGAINSTLDRLEGKPTQRVTIQSEHTETVRFVVEAAAPAQLQDMVKDPESGRWVSPNEIKQLAGASGPASGK